VVRSRRARRDLPATAGAPATSALDRVLSSAWQPTHDAQAVMT
jgi:hypothetical protein